MTNKLYILCGIPFSGKTTLAKTLAKKLGFTRIDLDEVKFDLYGPLITDEKIDQSGWDKIYQDMYQKIRQALKEGRTVIHDTGNFTKFERGLVKKNADKLGIETVTIFVDTPPSEAYRRLLANRKTKTRFNISNQSFKGAVEEMEPPDKTEKHIIFKWTDDVELWLLKNKLI